MQVSAFLLYLQKLQETLFLNAVAFLLHCLTTNLNRIKNNYQRLLQFTEEEVNFEHINGFIINGTRVLKV